MQRNLFALIEYLNDLPGIGRRSAMRIALSFLDQDHSKIFGLCQAIENFCKQMSFCQQCGNLQEKSAKLCDICLDTNRSMHILCVVENISDLLAIENTQEYHGLYHVLGGVLSPMDGVSPTDLRIESLLQRIQQYGKDIQEVLLATNPTLEGDATAHYISDLIEKSNDLCITRIQHGLASGQNIEYADQNLLAHSIRERRNI